MSFDFKHSQHAGLVEAELADTVADMGRVLVLGGTEFLGVHLVERLLDAGHDVTLFNRGETNPGAFPGVPKLLGDRDGDLSRLGGTTWDSVYDLSGYEPAHVERVACHINTDAQYIFLSTVNVYSDMSEGPLSENSPIMQTPLGQVDPESGSAYGELKALAETAVRGLFDKHVVVRPTVICGPLDPSDRVTYWVTRWAESGHHLRPEPAQVPVQFIDARDLADWLVHLQGRDGVGTFNAAAPSTTLRHFLDEISTHTNSEITEAGITEEFMREHDVAPWKDIPMWLPPSDRAMSAFFQVDATLAIDAGLRIRTTAETIDGILGWADTRRLSDEPRYGLTRDREVELFNAVK